MARARSWFLDLVTGAAAGALGSYLMSPIGSALSKRTSWSAKAREKANSPSESAPTKAGRLALEAIGIEIPDDKKGALGNVVHYGYGMVWGAAYALLRRKRPELPHLGGAVFGALLWLVSDELMTPLLGLAAPPRKYPKETHLRALAQHLAYGASVEEGVWLMRRALA